jgi:hypothetical protein
MKWLLMIPWLKRVLRLGPVAGTLKPDPIIVVEASMIQSRRIKTKMRKPWLIFRVVSGHQTEIVSASLGNGLGAVLRWKVI